MRWVSAAGAAGHGVVLAAAFAFLARELTLPVGVGAGAAGCLVGAVAAGAAHARGVRLGIALVGALVVGLGLRLVARGLAGPAASLLGLEEALVLVEGLGGFGLGASLAFSLRRLAYAHRVWLMLEAALIVAAVAVPLAAHRDGMIARPLELADGLWRRGVDPVVGFMALGGLAAALAAASFVRGRSAGRAAARLGLALLLVGGAGAVFGTSGQSLPALRDPPGSGGASGAAGEGEEGGRPPSAAELLEDRARRPDPNLEAMGRRPVAVAVFHKDIRPFGGVHYFRDAVFSRFNGVRLVEGGGPGVDEDHLFRFPLSRTTVPAPPEAPEVRTRVAVDVFSLVEHGRMFLLTDPVEVSPLDNPNPARFTNAWAGLSSVLTEAPPLLEREAGGGDWSTELWHHYTELPDDPRYLELARRIDARLKDAYREDPYARALAVKRHLEETTIYSFSRRYQGPDPVAEFLFVEGDRKGYCTHLAHSAALLLRALGVPTRVSAGYAVEARRKKGGSALLVRSGDAHAWVEIHLEGVGWVPIEITPERTDVEPPPFEEEDLQQLLGEMARQEGRRTWTAPERVDLAAWMARLRTGLLTAIAGTLLLAYGVRLVRLLRPGLAPERVGWAYRAGLDRLAAVGLVRRRGESRERFALRVAHTAPSVVPLTALLGAVVLGGQGVGRAPGGRSSAALAAAVGRELGRGLPWWRRLLGALHPVPWMMSR